VLSAEFDYFLLVRVGVRLWLAEHKSSRRRWINTVGFNGNIMVIADDEGHRLETPQGEQATRSNPSLPFRSLLCFAATSLFDWFAL
jgi:hypothetical protein